MASRAEQAVLRKKKGYNCAQAVACTYCDYAGVDEDTMKSITQAFGMGMGTMDGTCGAITGAGIVLGMDDTDQRETVQNIRQVMTKFKEKNQTVTCKVLKGIETGEVIRDCNGCVRDAAEFLENILKENK